ncbi:Nif3-like dinuclear metal center hexameric protein [Gordonia amarae]|nr:Nif3-like dinuclear metal center hexameric protein [Gordonia amarae]MCS3879661.1 dinuclear metal center YbgI/SA1388 family protein [Gordonia amarae]QHN18104.1 Nif3-like dinuclear metal center hexameric protein [Gordonia amarae]QHN22625.1 Nif3-like dinuclear metal center hexameric protein [Gordonia amarae]QHN31491.1 Nif3-like dinuclear metal center hexameric protein [Gordonia amarae]QHN40235.1 Nif3-like dinuclear metal center hexameric protein [Gordonia amarae]
MSENTAQTLARIIGVLDEAYPRRLAESWDSVGLVCGDPDDTVARALVCVDVTDRVVDQAIADGAGLILAHHPLLLRGVDSVAADTPKGRIVHRLIRSGIGLFTAHTNADSARPGVSDALAAEFGLLDTVPLRPLHVPPMDKWVVMVPEGSSDQVSEAMFAAGAGEIGDYRDCSWSVVGVGQFEPQAAANPTIGEIGRRERVDEARVEMVAERRLRATILAALRTAHPYEEPAFDVLELADLDSDLGLGRIGHLPQPMTAADFVALAQRKLNGPWGVRGTGDPAAMIATVAVCGGAGDSLLGAAAAAGVDAYLTGDLRHHPADEALRAGGPVLVDAGHWATEFPWCAQAAALLRERAGIGATVFAESTDPFGIHCAPGH